MYNESILMFMHNLRDLKVAIGYFTKENILDEGGYGIVYKGQLVFMEL